MDFEFLPIGSVVMLKESEAPVMIAGYLSVVEGNLDKVWNYSGFRFPIGYTDNDKILSFDHEQIELVIAYGYKDVEQENFIRLLEAAKHNAEVTADTEEESAEDNGEV